MLILGWDYVNPKWGCFLNCALVQWCIIIMQFFFFLNFSPFWIAALQRKKKNPGWILVIKSFIKSQWNKIGTGDEVESNGLLIAVNLQNFSPNYKKYWNKTKSVLCKKRRFDSLRMLRFLSLCCPVVVTLWYIPGLSILF